MGIERETGALTAFDSGVPVVFYLVVRSTRQLCLPIKEMLRLG